MIKSADKIRDYGTQKYVMPAHRSKRKRFSIRAGDIVRDLGMTGRAPSVCGALKSRAFLERNHLRLVEMTGPKSGQSTTVTYTYEFVDGGNAGAQGKLKSQPGRNPQSYQRPMDPMEAWKQLRGSLKDVYAEYGGGEAYLKAERDAFKDWYTRK